MPGPINDLDDNCPDCNAVPGEAHTIKTAVEGKPGTGGPCFGEGLSSMVQLRAKQKAKK